MTFNEPEGPYEKRPLGLPPSLPRLFRVWFLIGLGSFGGGASTFTLIRRAFVQQNPWLTNEEFVRYNGLCQLTPGINLLALTILIGRRLKGSWGIPVSLLGMLLPSVTLTILMTALYSQIRGRAEVHAAVQGVIPATIGLGLLSATQTLLSLLRSSRQEGASYFFINCVLFTGSGMAVLFWHLPVIVVLCGAGLLNALARWRLHRPTEEAGSS